MSGSQAKPQVDGLRQRHNPQSSPSLASSNSASASDNQDKRSSKTNVLYFWDDLPPWRRDNAYILSGYRVTQPSYMHAVRSLFYLHNESVNIWSHLLGAVLAVVASVYMWVIVQPRYASASREDIIVFGCFFGGMITCLGMSATYHMLLDHSEAVAKWGNKLDYTGIVALIVGSYVPTLYYGFFCKPELMERYLLLIFSLGAGCGLVSWVEKFRQPHWRPFRAAMFIGLGVSGVVPILQGVEIYGYQGLEDRLSLSLVILQGAMYIFGAMLYAFRWPERSSPGSYDIWGSSHQIFHIFVVLAAVTHFYGAVKAFDYHHTIMGSQCLLD